MAKLFLIKSNVAVNPSTGGHEKYVSAKKNSQQFSFLSLSLFRLFSFFGGFSCTSKLHFTLHFESRISRLSSRLKRIFFLCSPSRKSPAAIEKILFRNKICFSQ
jgi:hypothetical protein